MCPERMYSEKIFRTTPVRSLEDTLFNGRHTFLDHTLHYALPLMNGVIIGCGLVSNYNAAIVAVMAAGGSGYVQARNYINDLSYEFGNVELSDVFENEFRGEFREECRVRASIGVLRGVVEGSGLVVLGLGIANYFESAYHMVK